MPSVDAPVAQSLIASANAAELMGVTVLVSGVSVLVARALVEAGLDLGPIRTEADLRAAVEAAERRLDR